MNLLRWFSNLYQSTDDPAKSSQLDYSFLLPVTVGVGSIVATLLLRYRLSSPTSSSNIVGIKRENNSWSIKRETQRNIPLKKKSKSTPKQEYTEINEKDQYSNNDDVDCVDRVHLPSQSSVEYSTPNSNKSHKDVSVGVEEVHSNNNHNENIVIKKSEEKNSGNVHSDSKKSKKSKHSSKQKMAENITYDEIMEADPAWVVVTSKKSKHSTQITDTKKSVSRSTKRKNKQRGSEASADHLASENLSPSSSFDNPSSQQLILGHLITDLPVQDGYHSPIDSKRSPELISPKTASLNQVHSTMKGDHSTKYVLEKSENNSAVNVAITTTANNNINNNNLFGSDVLKKVGTSDITQSSVNILPNSVPNLNNDHTSTKQNISNSHNISDLPVINELISQHAIAQFHAKEAECQILRSEVIRLRDKIKSLESLSIPTTIEVNKRMIDSETMTLSVEESTPVVNSVNKTNTSTSVNNSDAIIISTLQGEIARLAKDVVIYQQRCDNLKSRLDTTNKKLSDFKSQSTDEAKIAKQIIESQSEKIHKLEMDKSHWENDLNDALQKAEVQRRKLEESENHSAQRMEELDFIRFEHSALKKNFELLEKNNSLVCEEKDHLLQKVDELVSKNTALLSDFSAIESQCNTLRVKVTEQEDKLKLLTMENQNLLTDSQQKIQQLEMLLTQTQIRQNDSDCKLQTKSMEFNQLYEKLHSLEIELNNKTMELKQLKEQNLPNLIEKSDDNALIMDTNNNIKNSISNQNVETQINIHTSDIIDAEIQCDESKPQNEDKCHQTNFISQDNKETMNETILSSSTPNLSVRITETDEFKKLQSEVEQYKEALDNTENILSKLQKSVDQEEKRWREALDASNIENELLKSKSNKLELALNELKEDRNRLKQTIENLQSTSQVNLDLQQLNTYSDENLVDKISTNELEEMSQSDLVHLITKLQCLVQIERKALKQEQSKSIELQNKLESTNLINTTNVSDHSFIPYKATEQIIDQSENGEWTSSKIDELKSNEINSESDIDSIEQINPEDSLQMSRSGISLEKNSEEFQDSEQPQPQQQPTSMISSANTTHESSDECYEVVSKVSDYMSTSTNHDVNQHVLVNGIEDSTNKTEQSDSEQTKFI